MNGEVLIDVQGLEKTFEGAIGLVKEEKGAYGPAKVKKPLKMVDTMTPLEQVIAKMRGKTNSAPGKRFNGENEKQKERKEEKLLIP